MVLEVVNMSSNGIYFNENLEELKAFAHGEYKKLQNLRAINVYLAHPEAIKIATQSLTPAERRFNVFVPNKYIRKDKMALLKDEGVKFEILKRVGLI